MPGLKASYHYHLGYWHLRLTRVIVLRRQNDHSPMPGAPLFHLSTSAPCWMSNSRTISGCPCPDATNKGVRPWLSGEPRDTPLWIIIWAISSCPYRDATDTNNGVEPVLSGVYTCAFLDQRLHNTQMSISLCHHHHQSSPVVCVTEVHRCAVL
jgi:hypothetical protein